MSINVLKVVKQHYIEELLSDGAQIIFEDLKYYLSTMWKNGDNRLGYRFITISRFLIKILRSLSTASTSISKLVTYPRSPTRDEGNKITLSNILNEIPKGIMLAE